MKNIDRLFFYFWRIIEIFLMWYGIVIIWIVLMYYKTLRSRVMFERMLWNIYIYVNYYLYILVKCFMIIDNIFLSLQLNKKVFESKVMNQKFFYLSSRENFENKIINQKFFYESNEVNINFFELFIINLFKKSNRLLCSIKVICKIFSSITILKKNILTKNVKKSNFNHGSNKKVTTNIINTIISGGNKQIKQNFYLQHKIILLTTDHPKFVEIIIDNNADHSVVVGNLTTSSKNATFIASSGILHKDEVFVYNNVIVEKLDNEILNNLEEIIIENKDTVYTTTMQSSEAISNNMNDFIEEKTNQKIFLKNEQIGIEEKIRKIEHYRDELDRMNSRED